MRPIIAAFLFFAYFSGVPAYSLTFAVFGDSHKGPETFSALLNKISLDKSISFAVNTGDITVRSGKREFDLYRSTVRRFGIKVYNAIGNHDIKGSGAEVFKKSFGLKNTYYSWMSDGALFIVLDNVSRKGLGQKQISWLRSQLSSSKGVPKFVFMHRPLFDMTGTFPEEVVKPKAVRMELQRMFETNEVKAVFWGHVHAYGKVSSGGVEYVLSGGAGGPLHLPYFMGGFNHYIKVVYNNGELSIAPVKLE